MITLFESENHKNVMFNDLGSGEMVQANQHLIIGGKETMLLDPGGHKVYASLFSEISSFIPGNQLKYIFFSHQCPDIVAATNRWLMVTNAEGFLSTLWMRFVVHFGIDETAFKRINPIPDKGMTITLNGSQVKFLPAHFLHSAGNFHVYDSASKILYSGDLGASMGNPYVMVEDFDAHIQYMEEFHKRYIPNNKALKVWANMARKLDIEVLAPQHGAVFPTKELVNRFIDWVEDMPCGLDLMGDSFPIPE